MIDRRIDLADAPVVDAHLHGFEAEALQALDPEGWADRLTLMGMCFLSSKTTDRALECRVKAMTDHTTFGLLSRRWLARHLGCEVAEVEAERSRRLAEDASGYLSGLLADERVGTLLVDDGYPLPMVDQERMADLVGAAVYRVARIEPMIEEAKAESSSAAELEAAFRARLAAAENDGRCVAYKTVIAYRSGLDVGDPTDDEVAESYRRWREADWRDGRDTSKAVRDRLVNITLEVASKGEGRPLHIHSGAGDPDCVLSHARPAMLAPLLNRFSSHPVVLIHSGFPWIEEGAYLAALYPLAYVELSLFLPWVTLDADRVLKIVLGSVPGDKILYGSDEASEPEVIWISARLARASLQRVLGEAVEFDYLTEEEARRLGRRVLAGNAAELHGIEI
ncbi:MAG: amidohydrolase family protein [Actinobacteria bacterium]|nr:amidohydrolase family protein [Actinomycetota bacterium]